MSWKKVYALKDKPQIKSIVLNEKGENSLGSELFQ